MTVEIWILIGIAFIIGIIFIERNRIRGGRCNPNKKILLYMTLLFYDYKDITQYNQNRGVFVD